MAASSAKLWLLDGAGIGQNDLAFFTRCLGGSESGRLGSFLRPERRRQFLLGRMLLRIAVSDLTGLPVDVISVVERPGNAPRLVLPGARRLHPSFSLSHSRNWVACLIGCGAALGLDIEVNDAARDLQGIAEMAFQPDELRWLSSRPAGDRVSSFYDLWCEREALYKLACALDRAADSSNAEAEKARNFVWRGGIAAPPGLSIVAASDRRLSGIEQKVLSGFSRDEWMDAMRLVILDAASERELMSGEQTFRGEDSASG
jgi:4'-phosphopantetheinyl transferase